MATLEFANGTQRRYETSWPSAVFQLYNKIDFSRNNGSNEDVVQCLLIPAGTAVLHVVHLVNTPEGGTSTGTVGDGDDADGWIASVNNNASAGTALFSNGGVYYASEDTIDMTLSDNAVDTAVIEMVALCMVVGY